MVLPTGTVTFLFTDIEESTPLLERVGPEVYNHLLEDHNRIVRHTMTIHGGVEVKTLGDGFLVAFTDATEAVCAASAAQQALTKHIWPEDTPVRVRMGVHTGDAIVVDDDYVGLPVHEAARVSAAANGGQVLISQATRDLIEESSLCGGELHDLGLHRLKGIARPTRLYRLSNSDIAEDLRPPRTIPVAKHNLPAPTTTFVGRELEVMEVSEALEDARIVTLTGVGGVGKTRLALSAAASILNRYPDGVWLIELAPIGDRESLPMTLATGLGAERRSGVSFVESVIDTLRDKSLLVLLDNCEHLLGPVAELVETIIQSCPGVSVLATSRERLSCEGERVLIIASLATPAPELAPSDIESYPSVALFLDRARGVRNDFALTAANAEAIAEIVRRLNGIPLALELAAARIGSMRAEDIAKRLEEVFRLLTGGRRTAVERQRTLRGTIDWSYKLLTDNERLVFDRLSVFAGGFELEAASAVCSCDAVSPVDVEDAVTSLVEKSMVIYTPGDGRSSLLEPLRQYGADRLEKRGETETIRRKHAEHFTAFAEQADAGLRGRDEVRWMEKTRADIDNLRSAFLWALEASTTIDLCMRMCSPQTYTFGTRWGEFCVWAEQLMAVPDIAAHPLYSRVLSVVGTGRWQQGDVRGAREAAEGALQAARNAHDRGMATLVLGHAYLFMGMPLKAADLLEQAAKLFAETGDQYGQFFATGSFAVTCSYGGEQERALNAIEDVNRRVQHIDNPSARAGAMYFSAEVLLSDDPERALEVGRQALTLARAAKNTFMEGVSLVNVVSLLGRHGEPIEALTVFSDVLVHWRNMGTWSQQWNAIRNLTELFARIGHDEPAAVLYGAAEKPGNAPPVFGPHGDRFNNVVRALEKRMGPTAFAAARARGELLGAPDAVAFAEGAIEQALEAQKRSAALARSP